MTFYVVNSKDYINSEIHTLSEKSFLVKLLSLLLNLNMLNSRLFNFFTSKTRKKSFPCQEQVERRPVSAKLQLNEQKHLPEEHFAHMKAA